MNRRPEIEQRRRSRALVYSVYHGIHAMTPADRADLTEMITEYNKNASRKMPTLLEPENP